MTTALWMAARRSPSWSRSRRTWKIRNGCCWTSDSPEPFEKGGFPAAFLFPDKVLRPSEPLRLIRPLRETPKRRRRMAYVDGFVIAVPKDKLDDYKKMAKDCMPIW